MNTRKRKEDKPRRDKGRRMFVGIRVQGVRRDKNKHPQEVSPLIKKRIALGLMSLVTAFSMASGAYAEPLTAATKTQDCGCHQKQGTPTKEESLAALQANGVGYNENLSKEQLKAIDKIADKDDKLKEQFQILKKDGYNEVKSTHDSVEITNAVIGGHKYEDAAITGGLLQNKKQPDQGIVYQALVDLKTGEVVKYEFLKLSADGKQQVIAEYAAPSDGVQTELWGGVVCDYLTGLVFAHYCFLIGMVTEGVGLFACSGIGWLAGSIICNM